MSEIDLQKQIDALRKRLDYLETNETALFDMAGTELTIASGAITKGTGKIAWHRVDTQGDAASDDLDTINGGQAGDILFLSTMDNARDVVLKDATDNLRLVSDYNMISAGYMITLLFKNNLWYEVSRSDI